MSSLDWHWDRRLARYDADNKVVGLLIVWWSCLSLAHEAQSVNCHPHVSSSESWAINKWKQTRWTRFERAEVIKSGNHMRAIHAES